MKQFSKNWPTLYLELAEELRERLSDDASLISHIPEKQINFSVPSQNLLDEFKNIFHYKVSKRFTEELKTPAEDEALVRKTLQKYNLFVDNAYPKSEEISSVMDEIINRTFEP